MGGKPWTHDEKQRVAGTFGWIDVARLAKELGRSPKAVEHVARSLGLSQADRSGETLRAFEKRTGFDRRQVEKAIAALGLFIPRKPRISTRKEGLTKHRFERARSNAARARSIPPNKAAKIVAWLLAETKRVGFVQGNRRAAWGFNGKPDACRGCGRDDREHTARGLCKPCYDADRHARARKVSAVSLGGMIDESRSEDDRNPETEVPSSTKCVQAFRVFRAMEPEPRAAIVATNP